MTEVQIPVSQQVDVALDEVQRVRAEVMARPASVERSVFLAELADVEACWWAVVFEYSRSRVQWRAALVAREHALDTARRWRRRAAAQRVCGPHAVSLSATGAA